MPGLSNRKPPRQKWIMPTIVIVAVVVLIGGLIATVVAGGRIF